VLGRIKGYSLSNYAAGILNLLPPTILPLLITNNLGSEKAAFYYIIMMIGNLMYSVPWATTKSLFAEGSHDDGSLGKNTILSSKIIATLLLPIILVLYFFGDSILLIFGKAYSKEGFDFLRLIAISAIPVSVYSVLGSYFKVRRDPRWLIVINAVYASSIIIASYVLLQRGLIGIGISWILGNALASIAGILIYIFARR
jgi:O-antigen/teichoic acid export membrane protein